MFTPIIKGYRLGVCIIAIDKPLNIQSNSGAYEAEYQSTTGRQFLKRYLVTDRRLAVDVPVEKPYLDMINYYSMMTLAMEPYYIRRFKC